jgi:hypothetical protein
VTIADLTSTPRSGGRDTSCPGPTVMAKLIEWDPANPKFAKVSILS